jgi:hypothetical protein
MQHPIRFLLLALAFLFIPACSTLHLDNPVAAARTLDQRAYALLNTYAAVVEEATDIVRDPATPLAFIRVLGAAEHAATPAAETLEIAVAAYAQASDDLRAASSVDQSEIERAADALAIASRHLSEAATAAEGPIAEFQGLVDARRS